MLKTAPSDGAPSIAVPSAERLSYRERFSRWRYHNRHPFEGWLILAPILFYYSVFFSFPSSPACC